VRALTDLLTFLRIGFCGRQLHCDHGLHMYGNITNTSTHRYGVMTEHVARVIIRTCHLEQFVGGKETAPFLANQYGAWL